MTPLGAFGRVALEPLDGAAPRSPTFGPSRPGTHGPASWQEAKTPGCELRAQPSFSTLRATGTTQTLAATSNLSEADTIKVAVRVRPLFPKEKANGATEVLKVTDDHSLIKVVVPGPAGNKMQRDFAFHACLGPDVSQSDVLHMCGIPQLLDAALAGYNVTIFAYGQTGSGKTFTMSGREDVIGSGSYTGGDTGDGITSRSVAYLYQQIRERSDSLKVQLSASYLEIYNEGIYDLLNLRAKNLPVKWDAVQGFYVPGLKSVACSHKEAMMDIVRTGMQHRHVGSHELNIESSRSHSIMTITCAATPIDPEAYDFGTTRFGKISFVDLAGSERLKDSKSEGTMLKETTNINKSLFVLGKVISALAERDMSGTNNSHIPYRDSKLTKLLMDSLGGCAMALMIACCSPSSLHVEETISTLGYATRAKNIQNRPVVQYDPKEQQITALRREIDLLRQENIYLREQIQVGGNPWQGDMPLSGDRNSAPTTSARRDWPTLRDTSGDSVGGSGGGAAFASAPGIVQLQTADSPHGSVANSIVGGSTVSIMDRDMLHSRSHADSSRGPGEYSNGGAVSASAPAWASGAAAAGEAAKAAPEMPVDFIERLKSTQALLARFSAENTRLAKENDRLRTTRQVLSSEHEDVLSEIESLRGRLSGIESAVVTGAVSPSELKSLLSGLKTPGMMSRPASTFPRSLFAEGQASSPTSNPMPGNGLPTRQDSPQMDSPFVVQASPHALLQQQQQQLQDPGGGGATQLGGIPPPGKQHEVANVMVLGLTPQAATRSRGASTGTANSGSSNGGIIVADKSKLNMLLGIGGGTSGSAAAGSPQPQMQQPQVQQPQMQQRQMQQMQQMQVQQMQQPQMYQQMHQQVPQQKHMVMNPQVQQMQQQAQGMWSPSIGVPGSPGVGQMQPRAPMQMPGPQGPVMGATGMLPQPPPSATSRPLPMKPATHQYMSPAKAKHEQVVQRRAMGTGGGH